VVGSPEGVTIGEVVVELVVVELVVVVEVEDVVLLELVVEDLEELEEEVVEDVVAVPSPGRHWEYHGLEYSQWDPGGHFVGPVYGG